MSNENYVRITKTYHTNKKLRFLLLIIYVTLKYQNNLKRSK